MSLGLIRSEIGRAELAEATQKPLLRSKQGRICFSNEAACDMLGADGPEALSDRPLDTIFDEVALAQLAISRPPHAFFAATLTRFDGSKIPALVELLTNGADDAGETLSLVPIPQNADAFNAEWVLEAMPVGVVVVDKAGSILLVNAALETMFGYARAELLGRPIEDLLPQRFRSAHSEQRAGYWQEPKPRAMGQGRKLFALHADGSEFAIEIGLNPIHGPGGVAVLASVVDVSARDGMETAFKALVESSPYGKILADQQGEIILVNSILETMLGYDRGELLGQPVEMLLPERYRAGHPAHRAGFRADPTPRPMGSGRDLTALHKSGVEVPVEIGLTPIRWHNTPMTLAAITDITIRKKMELDLRQSNQQLEEFTYTASHDLRSPLRGIANLVDWISEDLSGIEIESVQHNLGRIRDRIGRMERLIDDLLKYARANDRTTEFTTIDPEQVIDNILAMNPAPSGFRVVVDSQALPFTGAKTPFETVLRNVIGNAFKHHGGDGGQVTITTKDAASYCMLSVSDDGPGIPEQARERVFRMFQALNPARTKSTGIGLAVSKRMAEAHGGRLELAPSRDGEGATFQIWWPRFLRKDVDGRR